MEPPSLTIGIEEEYQLVDRTSRALDSYITHFKDPDRAVLREQATSELLQPVLEVTSRVCETPAEVGEENKWRAARYGLDGELADFEERREVPTRGVH